MSSTYRILLVDNSETQAPRLQSLFAEQGWQTEEASTAEQAVEKLNRIVPDLIIVDHCLPELRGMELCKLIRLNSAGWNPLILMFTAGHASKVQQESPESWADDYLTKDTEDHILVSRVRALLHKSETNRRIVGNGDTVVRRARVLAVDDSPSYLEYLVHELSGDGYAVDAASNGPDALNKLKTSAYDCVVLDLIMPDMDGVEVCHVISERRADLASNPLVLMLTAHECPGEMVRGLESGADDFVGKSSDITVLKSRVRALLRRKFFQDALKDKEIEVLRAHIAREAAELKAAALLSQVTAKDGDLEETNRKLKETQMHLVHTANMAALGQLVAGIAHEINNPIAFVDNNCFLMKEKLEALASNCDALFSPAHKKLIQSCRDRLGESQVGLNRVKELIHKLRTFSRLDEGEFKTVNVHDSIDSVLILLKHRIRQIEIVKQFGGSAMLDCAPGELNQVLMNVLANAMDAIGDEPGRITIRTGVEGGMYCISVRDSGPGVPASIQSRLFQPFFTTKPVGKGTGLGLAISHSIIQAHKGQIEIFSPEGGGAEFRIRIPLDLNEKTISAINQKSGQPRSRQSPLTSPVQSRQ